MADDRVSLPIDFGRGPENAQAMRARLAELEAEARDLRDAFDRGAITSTRYHEEMTRLGGEARKLAVQFDRLDDAATGAATGRRGGKGGGVAGLGQSFMQLGRGVQDFQAAGLMGVLNNIEGIAMAVGGGAGLAGALTLAAVGFYTLGPLLKGAGDDAAEATDRIEELNEQIEKLEAKPLKLRADYEAIAVARTEVEMLQRAKDALDKAMGKQTQDESESGKAVGEAIEAAEMRPVIAAARRREVEQAIAGDVGLRNAANRAVETRREADRIRQALEAAEAANAPPDEVNFLLAAAAKAEADARRAESERDARRQAIETDVRAAQDVATRDAREGVGDVQRAGQDRLAAMLRDQGPLGAEAARQIGRAAPEFMPARRAAEEQAKKDKAAAEAARREEAQFAEQEWEDVVGAPERTGRQAAANLAKKRREAEQQANEAQQEANRLAGAFDGLFTGDIDAAAGRGMPEPRIVQNVARGLQGRRGITPENVDAVAEAIVAKALQSAAERAQARAGRAAGQAAGALGPALAPAIQGAIVANEQAQLRGGGVPDEALAARLRAEAQRQAATMPGVGPEDAFAIAAEVIREQQEAFNMQLVELRARGMSQAQALMAMQAQLRQQNARAWGMNRFRPMAPTNLTMRPF